MGGERVRDKKIGGFFLHLSFDFKSKKLDFKWGKLDFKSKKLDFKEKIRE